MDRPAHAGLRHLALNVRNLEEMKRFYVDVLGFAVEWEPDADNVYLSSGTDNLALHRIPGSPRRSEDASNRETRAPSALDHLGILVRQGDDVDRWAAYLEARGVELTAKARTHRDGARSCYFKDPDGNTVQIIHHPPISRT
jgi:catechol 2,3-dioxygenase-like lactoylglutathione lyase family enzyme